MEGFCRGELFSSLQHVSFSNALYREPCLGESFCFLVASEENTDQVEDTWRDARVIDGMPTICHLWRTVYTRITVGEVPRLKGAFRPCVQSVRYPA